MKTIGNKKDIGKLIPISKRIPTSKLESVRKQKAITKLKKISAVALLCTLVLQSPIVINAEQLTAESNTQNGGYRFTEQDYNAPAVSVNDNAILRAGQLEAKYAPLDNLLPVREQGADGTCWAFAMNTISELSLLRRISTPYDFSEEHLVQFSYRTAVDSLGLTQGDKAYLKAWLINGEIYRHIGGNYQLAAETLLNWKGEADERNYPYGTNKFIPNECAFDAIAHVQNVYQINIKENPNRAKEWIKANGGIAVSYMHKDSSYDFGYDSYCSSAVPNPGEAEGHGVVIVGWDDTFPKEQFNATVKPSGDGAWLIRNDWGDRGGCNDYFWMSYYEPSLADTGYVVEVVVPGEPNYYDNIYYYDGGTANVNYTLQTWGQGANVFTSVRDETVKAVGVEFASADVEYVINVYQLNEGYKTPEDGTIIGYAMGKTSFPGYYTIPLTTNLRQGDAFSVVVDLPKGGELVGERSDAYAIYDSYYKTIEVYSIASAEPKTSFLSEYGMKWTDITDIDDEDVDLGNLRIKVYTDNRDLWGEEEEILTSKVSVSADKAWLLPQETLQLKATVSPSNADDKQVFWSCSDPSVVKLNAQGQVKALRPGTVTIYATARDGASRGQFSLEVKAEQITDNDKQPENGDASNPDNKTEAGGASDTNKQPESGENSDANQQPGSEQKPDADKNQETKPESGSESTSELTPENNYDNEKDYRFTIPVSRAGTKVASFQGMNFYEDSNGNKRCYKDNGVPIINEFKCDGTYTYYFQLDGTCMKSRLSYHPDGEHVIYLDENGHEVFSNFANVKQTIEGNAVDDFCFFDVHGYLYVDVVTFDLTGTKLYYANQYGVMERGKWFEFSDTCRWADGKPFDKAGGRYGYAMEDGSLMTNTSTYDWEGRLCYLQGNGVAIYE